MRFATALATAAFATIILGSIMSCNRTENKDAGGVIGEGTVSAVVADLTKLHGEAQAARIATGVGQAARLWRVEDGDADAFSAFCREQFIADTAVLSAVFARFENNLMLIDGYLTELGRDLTVPMQLDAGPMLPVDRLFAEFSPGVHVSDDLFTTRVAFTALLNFPMSTLRERLASGPSWSRRHWAEVRLADRFAVRLPSDVNQAATAAYTAADTYISTYNIYMHNLLDANGERLFPEGLRLITHWGLRDELKAQYDKPDGLRRQRAIRAVMEHIIRQTIPAAAIDNADVDWSLANNSVALRPGARARTADAAAEPDTRYRHWLAIFRAERARDQYFPGDSTYIARKFNREREIPEAEVEALLTSVLAAPVMRDIAALVARRLGRPLEPFDIWYNGFRPKLPMTEEQLDALTARRYPTVAAFEADIPSILGRLGFSRAQVAGLADAIAVDPSRGAGHAMGAGRLSDKSHLRTRVAAGGMNYKGYNIAVHELGHNVEQTFSFRGMDHTLLRGVPNTAFTEAFAFVFQSRNLDLLGVRAADPDAEALAALDVAWSTYEIAGVALTDMRVWRWLYESPGAEPAQLKEAVIRIATEVWNQYYAPVLGARDVPLLAIYSHMIDGGMYTPDYPLGHIISYQIEQYIKTRSLAAEMERMCRIGSVSPGLWMQQAVGAPISTEPMLRAAASAVAAVKR
jgi:hypothetical protein